MPINVFEMVIVIVIVGAAARVLNNWIKHRGESGSRDLDQVLDRLEDLEDLEDRVRVLEAVITDQNYDLKRQLHELDKE